MFKKRAHKIEDLLAKSKFGVANATHLRLTNQSSV